MRGYPPRVQPGIALILTILTTLGCGSAAPTATPPPSAMDQLVAAAKAEGELNLMTILPNWCNYGELIDTYKQRYGLKINSINPEGSSGDEIKALEANQKGDLSVAPDVLDMGLAFGPQGMQEGLLQPYKVATWDTIPQTSKDLDGTWYGSYYSVMLLEINADMVKTPPQEWADLLKPEYKGQVALAGDPRASGQAINSVYAVALANGGALDNAAPGLDFFAKLNQAGNFVPVIADQKRIASGQTPIALRWDFNALADRDELKGKTNILANVPSKGVLAGISVQAISKFAPHPNAAKLWEELLYSDEGQLMWLKGYCHPIRYNDLARRQAIPVELSAKLPPAAIYASAQFPTVPQFSTAKDTITKNWDKVVGTDVK